VGSDDTRALFVFDPAASYSFVQKIKDAGMMPTEGLRYVAAVTGPWKIFKVMTLETLQDLPDAARRLDAPGDPETAASLDFFRVRKSIYRSYTALVRIDTGVADPSDLIEQIGSAIETPSGEPVEADVVVGAFDILACVVADDEIDLRTKIMKIREIDGVGRTTSMHVIDYVSTSENAPADHQVMPASD